MKVILSSLMLIIAINLHAQDSIPLANDTNQSPKISVFLQTNFLFNYGNKLSGGGIIHSFKNFKLISSISFKHRSLFLNKDSIQSNLPYSINDSTIFYNVRSYTNQKYFFRLGLESNFKSFKTLDFQIGALMHYGKYKFQDYQADVYYNYYKDTVTQLVYYHDIYGYPSWDPLDAQTNVLRYSKADMEYRMIGFEPYLDFYASFNKFLNTSFNISMRYEQFKAIQRNYLDYAGVLNNPLNKFHKWRFNASVRFVFNLVTNSRNSPKTV